MNFNLLDTVRSKQYSRYMLAKQILRKQLIARRRRLTQEQVVVSTERITTSVLSGVDWGEVKSVHVYSAQKSWNEIHTYPLVEALKKTYPKLIIATSEAEAKTPLPASQYDVIIVPVLGFDDENYRLGMGRGWYDRFLATQPRARKFGFAYDWSRVADLPHEPHDMPLDDIFVA
jgi:5-formyltetrahydrofolate cyclo-ligase